MRIPTNAFFLHECWWLRLTYGCMCSVLPRTCSHSKHKRQLAKLTHTTCYSQCFFNGIINFKTNKNGTN